MHSTTSSPPWEMTYRTRLLLGVVGLVLGTGTVVLFFAHRSAQESADVLTDALFREASNHAVSETRSYIEQAPPVVEALRRLAGEGLALDNPEQLARQLLAFLEGTPGLSWVSYGDVEGTFTGVTRTGTGEIRINRSRIVNGKTRMIEHAIQANGTWVEVTRDDDSGYDPRKRPFYTKAQSVGQLVWLPPYVFYNEGVPGISCAAPIVHSKGQFRGVVSVDFDLNSLSRFITRLSVSPHSRFLLFTSHETLLAHPTQQVVSRRGEKGSGTLVTLADTDDPLAAAFRGRISGEPIPAGETESFKRFEFDFEGKPYFASMTTFRLGDDQVWVVGAVAPKEDFLADVWRSQAFALAAAAGALLFSALVAVLMARSVSKPVQKLVALMRRVGSGDLEARADFSGTQEFRELSTTLNDMISDLRDRVRLRHSLDVAMQVQQQLLPRQAPVIAGLDIAGHSTYCDETGGDYYDFLPLAQPHDDSLLVVLGDVMGHGVASALVMAGVRAILRDRAANTGEMAALLGRLNNALAADLQGERFMTMYLAVLSAKDRTYRWASAGHDPALVYDPGTDAFTEDPGGDIPLGVVSGIEYSELTAAPLRTGQVILIGTDGVWEMINPDGELYGKDRLKATIRAYSSQPAQVIVEAILASLTEFRRERRPTDDVTFMILKVV